MKFYLISIVSFLFLYSCFNTSKKKMADSLGSKAFFVLSNANNISAEELQSIKTSKEDYVKAFNKKLNQEIFNHLRQEVYTLKNKSDNEIIEETAEYFMRADNNILSNLEDNLNSNHLNINNNIKFIDFTYKEDDKEHCLELLPTGEGILTFSYEKDSYIIHVGAWCINGKYYLRYISGVHKE